MQIIKAILFNIHLIARSKFLEELLLSLVFINKLIMIAFVYGLPVVFCNLLTKILFPSNYSTFDAVQKEVSGTMFYYKTFFYIHQKHRVLHFFF